MIYTIIIVILLIIALGVSCQSFASLRMAFMDAGTISVIVKRINDLQTAVNNQAGALNMIGADLQRMQRPATQPGM